MSIRALPPSEPLGVEVPGVGWVAVDIDTAGFLVWMEKGSKNPGWPDSYAFLRTLLKERVEGSTPISTVVIDDLSNEQLDDIAGKLVPAARDLLEYAPTQEDTAESSTDLSAGQPNSALLQHILENVLTEFKARSAQTAKITASVQRLIPPKPPGLEIVSAYQNSLSRLTGASALTDLVKRSSLLGSIYEHGVLRDAIDRMSLYRQLGAGVGTAYLDAARLIYPAAKIAKLSELLPVYTERASVARLANEVFRLGLPAASIAASASLAASVSANYGVWMQAAIQPGFQATAWLGLEGEAPAGVVADVLRHYGESADPSSPAFQELRSGIELLDSDEEAADSLPEALLSLATIVFSTAQRTRDVVVKIGLLKLLNTLIAVASFYVAVMAYEQSQRDPDQQGRIQTTLEKVDQDLKEQNAQTEISARTHRYVHAPTPLRAEPNRDGLLLRRVYPDQLVRVIEANDRWAKVEIYDYGHDAPMVGWISRRALYVNPN